MLLVSKICSALLMAMLKLLMGLLPLKVYHKLGKWSQKGVDQVDKQRKKRIDLFLSVFLCFGAGLLLSICFIHLIPEVRDAFAQASSAGKWPMLAEYPVSEAVICAGFFLIYFLEELAHKLTSHKHKKRSHSVPRDSQAAAQLMHGRKMSAQYGHSHGPPIEDTPSAVAAIRGFLLVAALSFHSVFEGMAIGLQLAVGDVWFLFTAVLVHEIAIMFCMGMEMLASGIRILLYVAYMVQLGLVTSVGVAIGIFITEYVSDPSPGHTLAIAVLQGVAAGTLLYVTFMEVLERERRKHGNGLIKFLAILVGFVLLTGLGALGGHGGHSHGGGHHHHHDEDDHDHDHHHHHDQVINLVNSSSSAVLDYLDIITTTPDANNATLDSQT